jgi:hypothetical protein
MERLVEQRTNQKVEPMVRIRHLKQLLIGATIQPSGVICPRAMRVGGG